MLTQRYASSLARVAAACGALAFAAAAPAAAEPMFKLGQELPEMAVRVCPSKKDAEAEAAKSRDLAARPAQKGVFSTSRHIACETVSAIVIPESNEPAISPYVAWSITFDPESPHKIKNYHSGGDIPTSFRHQQVSFYKAKFRDSSGKWYVGWVEIPDEPYMLKYLEARKRAH